MAKNTKKKAALIPPAASAVIDAYIHTDHRRTDPTDVLGSYTGRPSDPTERPVQDADDL